MEAEASKEVPFDNMWRFFVDNNSSESCVQGQTTVGMNGGHLHAEREAGQSREVVDGWRAQKEGNMYIFFRIHGGSYGPFGHAWQVFH
jgi:hypothetical protein